MPCDASIHLNRAASDWEELGMYVSANGCCLIRKPVTPDKWDIVVIHNPQRTLKEVVWDCTKRGMMATKFIDPTTTAVKAARSRTQQDWKPALAAAERARRNETWYPCPRCERAVLDGTTKCFALECQAKFVFDIPTFVAQGGTASGARSGTGVPKPPEPLAEPKAKARPATKTEPPVKAAPKPKPVPPVFEGTTSKQQPPSTKPVPPVHVVSARPQPPPAATSATPALAATEQRR